MENGKSSANPPNPPALPAPSISRTKIHPRPDAFTNFTGLKTEVEKLPRDFNSERVRQIDFVFLLLRDDPAQRFTERKFTERLRLANSLSIIGDGLTLVFEVEA